MFCSYITDIIFDNGKPTDTKLCYTHTGNIPKWVINVINITIKIDKIKKEPHDSFHETVVVLADADAADRLMPKEASEHLPIYQSRFFVYQLQFISCRNGE